MGALLRRDCAVILALTLFAILLLAVPASAAACGEEGGEDTGPLIIWAQSSPGTLPYEGGTVTVATEIEDDCGVQQVYAEINSTEGTYQGFQLLPFENINSKAIVYRGEFAVPPNYQEWPITYQTNVSVEDTNGAFAEALAGETEVAAAPQFDEAPYVANASVMPLRVGSAGGQVKISADASDNRSVSGVFAIVTLPDETQQEAWLEPTSSSHFEGRYKVPANPGATAQQYSVVVYAEDDIGQRGWESAGAFTVSPRTGQLNAWTSAGSYFGHVALGSTATRLVTVHNSGGPKTQPVDASIATSGAPFVPEEASGGKVDFTLDPGETRTFAVDFAPASPGFKVGSAILSRADAAQPDISVKLTGQGISPPTV
jgi:hypothetical protein